MRAGLRHIGISVVARRHGEVAPDPAPCRVRTWPGGPRQAGKRALTRNWTGWDLDLGLPGSLQNSENKSLLFKPLSLWYVGIKGQRYLLTDYDCVRDNLENIMEFCCFYLYCYHIRVWQLSWSCLTTRKCMLAFSCAMIQSFSTFKCSESGIWKRVKKRVLHHDTKVFDLSTWEDGIAFSWEGINWEQV